MVVLSALRIKVEIVDVCMWSVTKMWNNFVGIKFHFYQGTHMVQEVILLRSLKWNVTLPYSTCLILKYKIMSPIAKHSRSLTSRCYGMLSCCEWKFSGPLMDYLYS
jgi:hypothetical protein